MEPHLILGLGELLWDLLPEGPRLGGAPANFTVMAGRLGSHAAILSRIGRDDLGRRAVELLDPLPADTEFLQVDPAHETGRVTVALKDGQPEYAIHEPAAWDFMELTDDWVQLAERADAICFGSLAQRAAESRQTIQTLAAQARAGCVRVFDVNLRAPFYSSEVIQESLELASVVKMNDAEVPVVLGLLGFPERETLRAGCGRLLQEFPELKLAAVTCGGNGSLLVSRESWHQHPGVPVKVVDTIGAGDAFTAAMTHTLLQDPRLDTAGLARLNEAGNRWGAWVASQQGAMPELSEETKRQLSAFSRQLES
jgi:fructokinase